MAKAKPRLSDITPQEAERFWGYVLRGADDECWPWTKCAMRRGYGAFTFQKWTFKTHRIAYFLHYGTDPGKLCVLHHCDHPACCNPAHLFLGTFADNTHDMMSKGRISCGQKHMADVPLERLAHGTGHHNAKLTEESVRQIRTRYAQGGISQEALGHIFGVDQTIISDVVRLKIWRHV